MRRRDLREALDKSSVEPRDRGQQCRLRSARTADKLDRAQQLAMIDLNVRALTDLSLAFLDSLERRKGGILNVASVAAFLPGPGMAVYYATKAYVLSFSEALHHELKAARRAGDGAVSGPGADRVPGARRHDQQSLSADPHAIRRTGGAARAIAGSSRAAASSSRAAPTRW